MREIQFLFRRIGKVIMSFYQMMFCCKHFSFWLDMYLIAKIKFEHTGNKTVQQEMKDLERCLEYDVDKTLIAKLEAVHRELWRCEDEVRAARAAGDRDKVFDLTGLIIDYNGERARLKREMGGTEIKFY